MYGAEHWRQWTAVMGEKDHTIYSVRIAEQGICWSICGIYIYRIIISCQSLSASYGHVWCDGVSSRSWQHAHQMLVPP